MKIQIKITGIEISIDTDEAPQAPAIVETTVQALEAAVQPLLATTAQPKARTVRTTKATSATPEPETTPTVVVEPQAATNGHDAGTTSRPPRMDFHEFDTLVRAEIKRLAPEPNILPSHSTWNEGRDPALPSWGTVLARYGCASTRSFAEKLGMNLAKPGPKPEPAT